MSGGVSLCVWMGGVGLELDRLRRDAEPLYAQLADLAHLDPVIDVIAGTSAGGLNGTLLASAIAWDSDLESLREVWLELGDLRALLQDMSTTNPRSLLKGDTFLADAQSALQRVLSRSTTTPGPDADARQSGPPVHALITTTLATPVVHRSTDAVDAPIDESTHLGLFRFDEQGQGFGGKDPTARSLALQELALAARSSASYPLAFEPSYVSIGSTGPTGVDMATIADFDVSRYVLDGGLTDNEPIDEVLTAVADQPATGEVRRVVALVSPLAGGMAQAPSEPVPTKERPGPSVWEVIRQTIEVPRDQSIANTVAHLTKRSGQARRLQDARWDLFTTDPASPDALTQRAQALVATASTLLTTLDELRSTSSKEQRLRPGTTTPEERHARQNLLIVQDLLRRALGALPDQDRAPVAGHRTAVSGALEYLGRGVEPTPATGDPPVNHANSVVAEAMDDLVLRVDPNAIDSDITSRTPVANRDQLTRLRVEIRGIQALGSVVTATDPQSTRPAMWSAALVSLDVLQSVATDGLTHNPQDVDFVHLSADAPTAWGNPMNANAKLTGIQVAHFGAFYAGSWRQNDWIWGRLDGSIRIVELLADPEQLLFGTTPTKAADALATGLGRDAAFRTEALRALENFDATTDATARDSARSTLARAIVEPLHAKILKSELGKLAELIDEDIDPNNEDRATYLRARAAIARIEASTDLSTSVDAQNAAWSLAACTLPAGEFGSDHFAQVATQAAAVAASMFGGASTPPPLSWLTKLVGPLARTANFLLSPASGSKTARWVTSGLLFLAALALIGWASSEVTSVIGIGGLAAWIAALLVGLYRKNAPGAIAAFVLALATAVLGFAAHHWNRPNLVLAGAALAAVAAVAGAVAVQRAPSPPTER